MNKCMYKYEPQSFKYEKCIDRALHNFLSYDVQYSIRSQSSSNTRAAIVGFCDLSSPDAETVLQRQCEHKRMRGIRNMLNYHEERKEFNAVSHDNYLTDPNWIRGFGLLKKYNLSFELHILPKQMMR